MCVLREVETPSQAVLYEDGTRLCKVVLSLAHSYLCHRLALPRDILVLGSCKSITGVHKASA